MLGGEVIASVALEVVQGGGRAWAIFSSEDASDHRAMRPPQGIAIVRARNAAQGIDGRGHGLLCGGAIALDETKEGGLDEGQRIGKARAVQRRELVNGLIPGDRLKIVVVAFVGFVACLWVRKVAEGGAGITCPKAVDLRQRYRIAELGEYRGIFPIKIIPVWRRGSGAVTRARSRFFDSRDRRRNVTLKTID